MKTFRNGVKLGRHRSLLRHYDNCFVAQEAITWFSSELRSKFDGTISRKQTLHLLQKFYKAGVFVEVTNHSSAKRFVGIKETDFKDNKRLYKYVTHRYCYYVTINSPCISYWIKPTVPGSWGRMR